MYQIRPQKATQEAQETKDIEELSVLKFHKIHPTEGKSSNISLSSQMKVILTSIKAFISHGESPADSKSHSSKT